MDSWTRTRPTTPGHYRCRFVPGYEFSVTVLDDGTCAWRGQRNQDQDVRPTDSFFDRAEWNTGKAPLAARASTEARA